MTTPKELIEALQVRYRSAAFSDRIKILDEFVALTGYHHKHAIRVLRQEVGAALSANAASPRSHLYDEAVRQALTVLREAADRVCGKRLKALIPLRVDAIERHGHLPTTRDGARAHTVYFTPATPCERLLARSSVEAAIKDELTVQFKSFDPVRLLQEIRMTQQTLSDIAVHGTTPEGVPGAAADVATFLQRLSSAWKEGEVRPTHRPQSKAERWWQTRLDPFADAWPVMEG